MREILFRGKRADNGEWIQGYLYRIWERAYILWGMKNDIPDMVEIERNTVCQYTGLFDKNGTKIFEGDIVSITDENTDMDSADGDIGEVEFCEGIWYIGGKVHDSLYDMRWHFQIEVIGNIFDNPELMEGNGE